jgi:hypothetical protein
MREFSNYIMVIATKLDTVKISSPPWEHIPASDASSDDYTRA